jgi:hypothetical protein
MEPKSLNERDYFPYGEIVGVNWRHVTLRQDLTRAAGR